MCSFTQSLLGFRRYYWGCLPLISKSEVTISWWSPMFPDDIVDSRPPQARKIALILERFPFRNRLLEVGNSKCSRLRRAKNIHHVTEYLPTCEPGCPFPSFRRIRSGRGGAAGLISHDILSVEMVFVYFQCSVLTTWGKVDSVFSKIDACLIHRPKTTSAIGIMRRSCPQSSVLSTAWVWVQIEISTT